MSARPDWAKLERDVVERIRLLAAIDDKLDAPEDVRGKLYRDQVLPIVRLLAEFCACVTISDDEVSEP